MNSDSTGGSSGTGAFTWFKVSGLSFVNYIWSGKRIEWRMPPAASGSNVHPARQADRVANASGPARGPCDAMSLHVLRFNGLSFVDQILDFLIEQSHI
jgi:hypothetical protein